MATKTNSTQRAAIVCPSCHWEYHPSEVFIGEELLGKPASVIKDALGKILYTDYDEEDEPCYEEHFECENCGKPFVVEAKLTFNTKPEEEELDFSTITSSLLD